MDDCVLKVYFRLGETSASQVVITRSREGRDPAHGWEGDIWPWGFQAS